MVYLLTLEYIPYLTSIHTFFFLSPFPFSNGKVASICSGMYRKLSGTGYTASYSLGLSTPPYEGGVVSDSGVGLLLEECVKITV